MQNAVGHARLVAERLTGTPRTYRESPWFWSDQFSTSLQIAGLAEKYDSEVVLGNDPDAFSVLLFHKERLRAVESVNRPGDHMAARRLIESGATVLTQDVTAPGFTLKGHLAGLRGGAAHPRSRR
ncbi:oxidoreductase C-terminal domain-containing protein [Streptomyces sp. NPDC001135]